MTKSQNGNSMVTKFITTRKRSMRQDNRFYFHKHLSVHRGCIPACNGQGVYTPLDTPPRQTPPWIHTPTGYTPPGYTHPQAYPPRQTPRQTPPCMTIEMGGTHTTGMHSCCLSDNRCIISGSNRKCISITLYICDGIYCHWFHWVDIYPYAVRNFLF